MTPLYCPWCGGNEKVLYLSDTGEPMFMCTQCHLIDALEKLLEAGRKLEQRRERE